MQPKQQGNAAAGAGNVVRNDHLRRLRVLRKARHSLASVSSALVDAIPATLSRTRADTYAAEVLPLLAACKFLEQKPSIFSHPTPRAQRPSLLARRHRDKGRACSLRPRAGHRTSELPALPAWRADPAGPRRRQRRHLEAGPRRRVRSPEFPSALEAAGLPEGLLRVTDDAVQTRVREIGCGRTRSSSPAPRQAGRKVLQLAAETATPVVVELSGCDLVVALESAQPERLVQALKFGMRLNGSATCMAPRRLILVGQGHESLIDRLKSEFAAMPGVPVEERERLRALLLDARSRSHRPR